MVRTKIYVLRIVLNRAKISLFESITDRKTPVSRDTQNVCAITIVGTAVNYIRPQVEHVEYICSKASKPLYDLRTSFGL